MIQALRSLFTTGGQLNPIAFALLIGVLITGMWGWTELKHLREKLELTRQCDVIQDAARDRLNTLNQAQHEQAEANQVISSGNFDNDFLERLQRDD